MFVTVKVEIFAVSMPMLHKIRVFWGVMPRTLLQGCKPWITVREN